jgi:hypothetical protein
MMFWSAAAAAPTVSDAITWSCPSNSALSLTGIRQIPLLPQQLIDQEKKNSEVLKIYLKIIVKGQFELT